ncbi:hypothetical protein [Cohnella lupini]|uniref:SMI1/KNR4 family protein n=1 Tax=Cohnella lupini TaxID=1294267 RepID=A0A3D9IWC3_9BACL|nr:hypothetical protein [Cohnella lupini]RED66130.1 hypothetical protein DFP95_101628 [Cohnella lupini]
MDLHLFEEALKALQFPKSSEGLSLNIKAFFISKKIPNHIIEFYERFSFIHSIRFGSNFFYKANDLDEENKDMPNSKCIESGLLIIGHGLNGDYIVLNLKSSHIGFIYHDELYENEECRIENIYIDMGLSLGEFYNKSFNEKGFPVDGYQAEIYKNNLV